MNLESLTAGARALDKYSIARLISLFENNHEESLSRRRQVLEQLKDRPVAPIVGFTGTPGAGKSTLIGRLAALVYTEQKKSLAILAIDPSSQTSGGSLLGDRTRVRLPSVKELFFRSQATDGQMGGLGRSTFQVCRLLERLFDLIFIETVGIGQNEIEIQHVADRVYLTLAPLGGDTVQFIKAGIMEIPDAIILNKADQPAAEKSFHELKASLPLARSGRTIPLFKASAASGQGLEEILSDLSMQLVVRADKAAYFLERWIYDEYGRAGLRFLQKLQPLPAATFEEKQLAFARLYETGFRGHVT